MKFNSCVSRTACTEDGTHCRSCGRSHAEIARTRQLTAEISNFIIEMEYDNIDDFLNYLHSKVIKKCHHAKTEA